MKWGQNENLAIPPYQLGHRTCWERTGMGLAKLLDRLQ
jgi:hypothetical protein